MRVSVQRPRLPLHPRPRRRQDWHRAARRQAHHGVRAAGAPAAGIELGQLRAVLPSVGGDAGPGNRRADQCHHHQSHGVLPRAASYRLFAQYRRARAHGTQCGHAPAAHLVGGLLDRGRALLHRHGAGRLPGPGRRLGLARPRQRSRYRRARQGRARKLQRRACGRDGPRSAQALVPARRRQQHGSGKGAAEAARQDTLPPAQPDGAAAAAWSTRRGGLSQRGDLFQQGDPAHDLRKIRRVHGARLPPLHRPLGDADPHLRCLRVTGSDRVPQEGVKVTLPLGRRRDASLPPPLAEFGHINRYWDVHAECAVAKILPGQYYGTRHDEMSATVLGSCVSACIRDKVLGIGGMNHFMLPINSDAAANVLGAKMNEAARYGVYAMELLINAILKHGGQKQNFEVKVVCGGRMIEFVRHFLATEGLPVLAADLGDIYPRKLHYFPATGVVRGKKLRSMHNDTIVRRERDYLQDLHSQPPAGAEELICRGAQRKIVSKKIKVLVVDDSALIRQLLTSLLAEDAQIEVVGAAADPYAAREKIKTLQPDVLTLDVEMPRMDGLTFLRNLMRLHPMPVVMVSSLTANGADVTLEALSLGAVDFVTKPKLDVAHTLADYAQEIIAKVKMAAGARLQARAQALAIPQRLNAEAVLALGPGRQHFQTTDRIVAIGDSTGGTAANREKLELLPAAAPGHVNP